MADDDREVNVNVKWSQSGQQDVSSSASQMTQNWKSYNGELSKTEQSFRSLRTAGREVSQIGREMLVAGAALTGALVLDANNYVKTVGQTTALGAAWIDNTNKIKQANLEIGQTTANVMLPAYQLLGNVIQNIASIVQSNPSLVSSALAVGGTLTAMGTLETIVGSVIRVVSDAGLLVDRITSAGQLGATAAQTTATVANTVALAANTAALAGEAGIGGATGTGILGMGAAGSVVPAGGAVAAAGGLTVAGVAGVVLAGLGLGIGTYAALQKPFSQKTGGKLGGASLGQIATVGAYETGSILGKIMGDDPQKIKLEADIMAAGVGKLTGALTDSSPLVKEATDTIAKALGTGNTPPVIDKTAVDDYTSYEQQITDATTTYEAQRTNIIETTEQTITDDTANYEEQQATDQRNYQQELAKDQRDFQEKEANDKATHNLDLQKLEQDHASKMQSLADDRDALGLVNEQNSYDQQVSQSDAQFALQESQAQQSYANQLADQKQSFDNQEADQKAAYDKQIAAAKAQETKQLAAADTAYQKQLDDYQTAFVDKINAIDSAILGDTKAYDNYLANQAVAFQGWISRFQAQGGGQGLSLPTSNSTDLDITGGELLPMGPHQAGGYVSMSGAGENGLPEYMLSNPTTTALESLLGGGLSEAALLSAVMAGRGGAGGGGTSGGGNVYVTVQGGSLSMSQVYAAMDNLMDQKLGDLLPAWSG